METTIQPKRTGPGGRRTGAGRKRGHKLDLRAFFDLANTTLEDGRLALSVDRVVFATGSSPQTVQAMIRDGTLPAVYVPLQIGKRVVFEPKIVAEDLLEFVRRNSTHAAVNGRR